jgi:hypothetical protein
MNSVQIGNKALDSTPHPAGELLVAHAVAQARRIVNFNLTARASAIFLNQFLEIGAQDARVAPANTYLNVELTSKAISL